MVEKSNVSVACNDDFAPEWIINDGKKYVFVRPAFVDEDGGVPLDQLADNECIFAPGGIYTLEEACFANKGDSDTNMLADMEDPELMCVMLQEQVDSQINLINEMREGFQTIYAHHGENSEVASICNRLIEKSRP